MKIRAGDLRRLIREELAEPKRPVEVQPDPFKEPKQVGTDIKAFAKNIMQAEDLIGDMPKVLDEMSKRTKNLKAQALLRKGAGLAYHAMNDIKALVAVLTIVQKEQRKN